MNSNLELIKKLARLANNNPNDNEANLAARKVCKLLAEGEFSIFKQEKQTKTSNPIYNARTPYDFSGWPFRQYQQDFQNQQQQRQQNATSQTASEANRADPFWDIFRDILGQEFDFIFDPPKGKDK